MSSYIWILGAYVTIGLSLAWVGQRHLRSTGGNDWTWPELLVIVSLWWVVLALVVKDFFEDKRP